jgi:DnaK suppressor protein
MDAGRYGTCSDCAGPVEPSRLEILPQVARCVPCERVAGAQPST